MTDNDNIPTIGMDTVSGTQGTQGTQGPRGAQGAQGTQGPQGYKGTQGVQGYRGCDGIQGPQGTNGIQGPQGRNGMDGVQGYRGCDGAQGPQGVSGVQGPQGRVGLQGPQGQTGPKGHAGAQGYVGQVGDAGIRGAQGSEGPRGAQGYTGKTGPDGFRGAQGGTGVQGAQGLQGAAGTQGAQGSVGEKGYRGAQGSIGDMGETGFKGAQGPQGNIGERGVQGETGSQGHDGYRGLQGLQGRTGDRGYAGTQGAQGAQGFSGWSGTQGMRGATGAQGPSGVGGLQGPQGRAGGVGVQGAAGGGGTQGYQGPVGPRGAQGSTGKTGPQGVQGRVGTQGAQGNGGLRGAQGAQGSDGAQGMQGIRGAQGPQGYMGYEGDSGAVGIQGVTGEKGYVWDDGIRMNGYNTHLFEWDSNRNKFVPANPNDDFLKVRDGAVIRLWMTQTAFNNGIGADGTIKIDSVESGTTTLTEYPAYYSDNLPIADYITELEYNSVIQFTFRNNAWYYSGGIIGDYEGDRIWRRITVSGGAVGGYNEGDVVEPGTRLQELFERLLVRDVDVKAVNPKSNLAFRNNPNSTQLSYEVGSVVSDTLVPTFYDGYFTTSDEASYPTSKFNTNNHTTNGKLSAGCVNRTVRLYLNGSQTTSSVSFNGIPEGVYVYHAETPYDASIIVPKTSQNNDSSVSIPSGTAISNNLTITARYLCYYGPQDALYDSNIDTERHFTSQSSLHQLEHTWLNPSGPTEIQSITTTENKPSFVVVVPVGWAITGTRNQMGQDVPLATTWYPQNTITYTNGSETTTYQVYSSPSTLACEYTNIILEKTN